MRSSDFLLQLKKALENELSAAQVQDNVEYYRNYIKEEMMKRAGFTERQLDKIALGNIKRVLHEVL